MTFSMAASTSPQLHRAVEAKQAMLAHLQCDSGLCGCFVELALRKRWVTINSREVPSCHVEYMQYQAFLLSPQLHESGAENQISEV